MNQSGGIFYHYLALRNSLRYWRSFRNSMKGFIMEAFFDERKLLIGPSGGYSFHPEVLNLLGKEDLILELDPIAKKVLDFKLKGRCQFIMEDQFVVSDDPVQSGKLTAKSLDSFGKDTIVFCNVLGQLPYQYPGRSDQYWQEYLNSIFKNLKSSYFSYHDRWTFLGKGHYLKALASKIPQNVATNSKISLSHLPLNGIEILEHPTNIDIFEDSEFYKQVPWLRTSNCLHLIHCISHLK